MEDSSELKRKKKEKNVPSKSKGHWSQGLLVSMKDPNLIVLEDDRVVVIKDVYPKAKHHYLVCPKQEIATLKQVNAQHLPLLKHMEEMGKKVCEKHEDHTFKIGYHSVPSMVRLHLHVISDDFDSDCLKTKKHWNSFTSQSFVSSKDIVQQLEETGKINHKSVSESKRLIDQPLKCHKCSFMPINMPDLKRHIKSHLKPNEN